MATYNTALSHLPKYTTTGKNKAALSTLTIDEKRGLYAFVLRIDSHNSTLVANCESAGFTLPKPLHTSGKLSTCLRIWISPDEFLCVFANRAHMHKAQQALHNALQNTFYAIIDNSGGYAYVLLRGTKRIELLRKLCSYNLQHSFSSGKAIATLLAKAPAIIACLDNTSIFVIMRNSYANYLYTIITHEALEYQALEHQALEYQVLD